MNFFKELKITFQKENLILAASIGSGLGDIEAFYNVTEISK